MMIFVQDGEDSSVRIDISDVEPTEQGTLAPSWEAQGAQSHKES